MSPSRNPKRIIAYTRVSTEEQASSGLGLGAQRERIKAYCVATGRDLSEVVVDSGKSAKNLHRPGMEQVLAAVRARQVSTLIVWKLDRLTRSVRDLGFLLDELKKYNVDLVSVSESLDGSAAVGRLLIHMIGSIAQWERETAGERTADALTYKRLSGRAYGPTPFGYSRSGDDLIPNPHQQRALVKMRDMRGKKVSFNRIADVLNESQVKPSRGKKWYASSVKAVLESRMQGEVG